MIQWKRIGTSGNGNEVPFNFLFPFEKNAHYTHFWAMRNTNNILYSLFSYFLVIVISVDELVEVS